MSKTIVITSGKGGVGKTTVSAFLGARLAQLGKRTVICDLDLGLNNLDIVMGCEKQVVYDLSDALEGRCRANQALVESKSVKNLFMISSEHTAGGKNLNAHRLMELFEGLQSAFDYILLDCPAGIDTGFYRAVSCSQEALVVTTASLSALRDADKVLSVLRSYVQEKIGLVINLARGDLMVEGESLTVEQVQSLLKTKVVGVIPQDDLILKSKNCYLPENSSVGEAFKRLAESILSEKVKLYNPMQKYLGFFGSIKRGLKRKL